MPVPQDLHCAFNKLCPQAPLQKTQAQAQLRRTKLRGRVQCTAVLDPDSYEDEKAIYEGTAEPKLFRRASRALGAAGKRILATPGESWDSVKTTAGAALDMMLLPVDADQQKEVERESLAREASGNPEGPVTRARERWRAARNDMPKGTWSRIQWLWDQPQVKKLRITITAAQWSFKIPAILALLATQGSLIVSQLSLPLLAPLGVGFTMVIWKNASLIFPRICFLAVFLYLLWFLNSLLQNTVFYLRRQGAVDARLSGAIITASECCALIAAMVIVLSMIGVNVNALLLPAGIAAAYAAKDLSHNFFAGFFLFVVQPFKLGDRISVSYSTAAAGSGRSSWFEGICEKVDLRYTVVKSGSRRLFVPNSAFITREFMVTEDVEGSKSPSKRDLFPAAEDPGELEQPLQEPEYPSMQEAYMKHSPRYPWPDSSTEEAVGPAAPPGGTGRGPQWSPSRQWRGNGWRYMPTLQEVMQYNEQEQAQQHRMYSTPLDPRHHVTDPRHHVPEPRRDNREGHESSGSNRPSSSPRDLFNAAELEGSVRQSGQEQGTMDPEKMPNGEETRKGQNPSANIVPAGDGLHNQERSSAQALPASSREA